MLLGIRPLADYQSCNSWESSTKFELFESDAATLTFQLIDLSVDLPEQGFSPAGRRYCPASTSTLTCVIDSVDDGKKVTKVCTQPDARDASIWQFTLGSSDPVRGTPTLRLTLTEPSGVKRAALQGVLRVRNGQVV